jgi:hypothetical protein
MATVSLYHWYWRLEPVAVTESEKLPPIATVTVAAGCVEIAGLVIPLPLLEDEELDEELELLEEDDELEEEDEELLEDDEELLVPELLAPEEELLELEDDDELLDEELDEEELLLEEDELLDDEELASVVAPAEMDSGEALPAASMALTV